MKKIILTILLCGIVVLGLTGCETKTNVSVEELNNINNKIIDYFQKMVQKNIIIIVTIM